MLAGNWKSYADYVERNKALFPDVYDDYDYEEEENEEIEED